LRQKLGRHADSILTRNTLNEARRYFEDSIKRTFNPNDTDDDFDVPLRGADDIPAIGLEEGYLKLSKFENPVGFYS